MSSDLLGEKPAKTRSQLNAEMKALNRDTTVSFGAFKEQYLELKHQEAKHFPREKQKAALMAGVGGVGMMAGFTAAMATASPVLLTGAVAVGVAGTTIAIGKTAYEHIRESRRLSQYKHGLTGSAEIAFENRDKKTIWESLKQKITDLTQEKTKDNSTQGKDQKTPETSQPVREVMADQRQQKTAALAANTNEPVKAERNQATAAEAVPQPNEAKIPMSREEKENPNSQKPSDAAKTTSDAKDAELARNELTKRLAAVPDAPGFRPDPNPTQIISAEKMAEVRAEMQARQAPEQLQAKTPQQGADANKDAELARNELAKRLAAVPDAPGFRPDPNPTQIISAEKMAEVRAEMQARQAPEQLQAKTPQQGADANKDAELARNELAKRLAAVPDAPGFRPDPNPTQIISAEKMAEVRAEMQARQAPEQLQAKTPQQGADAKFLNDSSPGKQGQVSIETPNDQLAAYIDSMKGQRVYVAGATPNPEAKAFKQTASPYVDKDLSFLQDNTPGEKGRVTEYPPSKPAMAATKEREDLAFLIDNSPGKRGTVSVENPPTPRGAAQAEFDRKDAELAGNVRVGQAQNQIPRVAINSIEKVSEQENRKDGPKFIPAEELAKLRKEAGVPPTPDQEPSSRKPEPAQPSLKDKAQERASGDNKLESNDAFKAKKQDNESAIPAEVDKKYLRIDNKFYSRDDSKPTPSVAFEDKGTKLQTRSDNQTIAQSMVQIAKARGWDEIKVNGSEAFRKETWLEAAAQGMKVKGYSPSEQDKADLAKRTANTSINKIEQDSSSFRARENKTDQPKSPAPSTTQDAKATPDGSTKQDPRNVAMAIAYMGNDPKAAIDKYPELAGALAITDATKKYIQTIGYTDKQQGVVLERFRANTARNIAEGKIPEVTLKDEQFVQKNEKESQREIYR